MAYSGFLLWLCGCFGRGLDLLTAVFVILCCLILNLPLDYDYFTLFPLTWPSSLVGDRVAAYLERNVYYIYMPNNTTLWLSGLWLHTAGMSTCNTDPQISTINCNLVFRNVPSSDLQQLDPYDWRYNTTHLKIYPSAGYQLGIKPLVLVPGVSSHA